jgi:hypothetical protein
MTLKRLLPSNCETRRYELERDRDWPSNRNRCLRGDFLLLVLQHGNKAKVYEVTMYSLGHRRLHSRHQLHALRYPTLDRTKTAPRHRPLAAESERSPGA